MKTLLAVLLNEALKLKRTLALWLVLLMPLAVVVLGVLLVAARHPGSAPSTPGGFAMNIMTSWVILVQPLCVAIVCVLVHAGEHRCGGWRRLYVLPIRRETVYAGKLLVCVVLAMLGTVATVMLTWLALQVVLAMGWVAGATTFWPELLARHAGAMSAVLVVVALQHWISMRWRSFVAPLMVAVAGTLSILTVASSERHWPFDPWTYGTVAANATDALVRHHAVMLGLVLAGAISVVGMLDMRRRELG